MLLDLYSLLWAGGAPPAPPAYTAHLASLEFLDAGAPALSLGELAEIEVPWGAAVMLDYEPTGTVDIVVSSEVTPAIEMTEGGE